MFLLHCICLICGMIHDKYFNNSDSRHTSGVTVKIFIFNNCEIISILVFIMCIVTFFKIQAISNSFKVIES